MDLAPTAAVPPLTILVVDDDEGTRYSIARTLRAAGYVTRETAGGAKALEMAAQGVDAVVLDVHLPDLHGFEVCRLLRNQPATAALPVVHVSAVHVRPDDHVTGLQTGADAYLVSPVEPRVLVATLEGLLRTRGFENEARQCALRYHGMFEAMDCAVALVDADGRFADVNPALAALLGQARHQLEGRRISALAPARWTVQVEQVVTRWGRGWRGEFPLRTADGSSLALAWSVQPHPEPGFSVAVVTPSPTLA